MGLLFIVYSMYSPLAIFMKLNQVLNHTNQVERSKFVNCINKLCQDFKDDLDLAKQLVKQDIIDLDKSVLHSWSIQEAAEPIAIAGGQGCKMWDYGGKECLDFSSQLVNTNIGHQHPQVIKAIKEQADSLLNRIISQLISKPESLFKNYTTNITLNKGRI